MFILGASTVTTTPERPGSTPGNGGRPLVWVAEVRAELERVLRHPEFQASERLRGFLRFVVAESLAGHADGTKGARIARRVFDRGEDFDGTRDLVVRVEAARLRRRLEHYYFVAGGRRPDPDRDSKGGLRPTLHAAEPGRRIVTYPGRHSAETP